VNRALRCGHARKTSTNCGTHSFLRPRRAPRIDVYSPTLPHGILLFALALPKSLRRGQDNGVATLVGQTPHALQTLGATRKFGTCPSASRPASTMMMEMHDRSGLDTAPQQLAERLRQRLRRRREGSAAWPVGGTARLNNTLSSFEDNADARDDIFTLLGLISSAADIDADLPRYSQHNPTWLRTVIDTLETGSRHPSSRHSSRDANSPYIPAGFSSVHGDAGRLSDHTNIASASHGHQPLLLEQLSSTSNESSPSTQGFTIANVLPHLRPCYLLVTLGFLVIGGSLAVGLYFSIAKDRMGDGFTTAGWMTAVGTLVLAAPMAKHYPHCKCWKAGYTILRHGHNTQV